MKGRYTGFTELSISVWCWCVKTRLVVQILADKDERGVMDQLAKALDLEQVMDRDVENLSGGELQRFAIAVCAAADSSVYMIDEPSSYLDVRQRLKAAQVCCSLAVVLQYVMRRLVNALLGTKFAHMLPAGFACRYCVMFMP